jgi:signal transduction histidine kinase
MRYKLFFFVFFFQVVYGQDVLYQINPAHQILKEQISAEANDTIKLQLCLDWIDQNKDSEPKFLLYLSETAFELSKKLQLQVAEAMLALGHACLINKNYSRAILFFQGARDYVNATSDRRSRPKVFLELGKYYEWRDRYDSAFYFYQSSYRLANENNDIGAIIESYLAIGRMYEIQRMQSGAINNYKKALALSEKHGYKEFEAQIYVTIGDAFSEVNKFDSAVHYLQKALSLYNILNVPDKISETLTSIGITYRSRMRLIEALSYFEQAMKLNEESSNLKVLASTLINLGSTYRLMGNFYNAILYLERGRRLAEAQDNDNLAVIAYQNLDDIYFSQKQYEKSAIYARKLNQFRDRLYNLSISEALTEVRVKFEAEVKEKENQLLREQKNTQDQIILKQKQILAISIIALAIILGVLAFVVKQYLDKKQTNKLLEQSKLEIERSHEEVQIQNEELRKLNSLKDTLFSVISHDLRSPLNSINGMLSLLSMSQLDQKEIAYLTRDLSNSVSESLNLLENLLNWARSQMKGYVSEKTLCDLSEIARENIRLFAFATEKKGNRIINHLPESEPIIADAQMIRLVLRNLLSNANKFTSNGTITLSTKRERNELHFSVEDTGVGMPQHVLEKLREKKSISLPGTKSEMGTGLGLMLCSEFASKTGSKLLFESVEQKGSCFTLVLPLDLMEKTEYAASDEMES